VSSAARDAALRVAVVAPSLRILGGQSIQADRLISAWTNDPRVHAWLVPHNPVPPAPFARWLGIKYLRTIVTEATYLPLLAREIQRADVVHVFSASYWSFLLSPLPAIVIARVLRRPVILHYHSGEAPDHLHRSRLARIALSRTHVNVVPSPYLADVFGRFGLGAQVVPNVVDLQRFRFRIRDPLMPRVLSVRNFEPIYNVAATLRAFQLVQRERPDATLTVVGGGGQDAELRALAADLRLQGVTFAGRVRPDDMAAQYDAHDVYVQSPRIDNAPVSVIEAFASGLPVVSTDTGGISHILVHERDGLLCRPDDDRALARGILQVLADPDAARRRAAAARAQADRYGWDAVGDQWLQLYRDLARHARVTSPHRHTHAETGAL